MLFRLSGIYLGEPCRVSGRLPVRRGAYGLRLGFAIALNALNRLLTELGSPAYNQPS